jgi:hypothetical protein
MGETVVTMTETERERERSERTKILNDELRLLL